VTFITLHELHAILAKDPDSLRRELLARISRVVYYAAELRDLGSFFDFVFWNVLDPLETSAAALWCREDDDKWRMIATVGGRIPIPSGFDSWSQFNELTMRKRRVSASPESGADTNQSILWASPCLIRGRFLILHLYCGETEFPSEFISEFVGAITPMFGHFDEIDMGIPASSKIIVKATTKTLTKRQSTILKSLNDDLTYAQIAQRMGFSESTIKQEAMKIFRLLNVSNRSEAVLASRNLDTNKEVLDCGV
jgi:DNA-binding CsgD family transcriptional regulator